MIRAYDKSLLFWAQRHLGTFLDYSVNSLAYPIDEIWTLFLACHLSQSFSKGNTEVILGRSGKELVNDVLSYSGYGVIDSEETKKSDSARSPEYWTGWSLAYYQWYTSLSFDEIDESIPIGEIRNLYYPYHEMDMSQFVEIMERIRNERIKETKLKRIRQNVGISQQQLSNLSDVPVRTIQQYEQRQKDINKASGATILKLSRALCTTMEELLEK